MNLFRKIAALSVLLSPMATNAELVDLGEVTRDTATNLEWLDLTVTAGVSYDDYLGGALGLLDDGWQIATGDQVYNLVVNYIGLAENEKSTDLLQVQSGGIILERLGCTLSVNSDLCSYSPYDPSDPIAFDAMGSFDNQKTADTRLGFSGLVIRLEDPQPSIVWDLFEDFYDQDRSEPQVGIYLNRAVQIPEPVTIDIQTGKRADCKGTVGVAIYGSSTLNVVQIDQGTLSFDGLDVSKKRNGTLSCEYDDLNADDYTDLVCKYQNSTTLAWLTGELLDGTKVEGTDTYCVF